MKRKLGISVGSLGLVLVLASCVVPINDLGGPYSEAFGINASLVVVGESQLVTSGPMHAYKRMPDDSVIDLGSLPGDTRSRAVEINDAGVATGYSSDGATTRAVTWNASNQITALPTTGWSATYATDINANGVVVGNGTTSAGASLPFVYNPATGSLVSLNKPGDAVAAYAEGLNDNGQIVGYAKYADNYTLRPVKWSVGSPIVTDIGGLTGLRIASDINNAGTIVGRMENNPREMGDRAAVWFPGSAGATPITLGEALAEGIDESGTVVGTQLRGHAVGFRWTSSGGLQDQSADESSTARDIGPAGAIAGSYASSAALMYPDS